MGIRNSGFVIRRLIFCLTIAALLAGCEEGGNSSITITSKTTVELPSVVSQRTTVSFEATGEWTASCPADWLTVSPRKGSAGSNTITLTTASTNRTKATRTAQVVIAVGTERRTVSAIQSSKYAIFDQKEYVVGAEGGTVIPSFKSNVGESDNLRVLYSSANWISWQDDFHMTRSEWEGSITPVVVAPNTSEQGRTAIFVLSLPSDDEQGWMGLDTVYVHQEGKTVKYESTDFSADGTVNVLQRSTVGNGIPIVLMGDGFADRDVADGTYDYAMNQTLENLFSEEPIKSLRDYFNVYSVTAVSRSRGVGNGLSTVFSTVPSNSSSTIDFDGDKVAEYLVKVDNIDAENSLAVVILNSNCPNGVTMLYMDKDKQLPRQYSVSLCGFIDGVNSEAFRQVLVHEAVGHGLAKLGDEYGYESNGAPGDADYRQLEFCHKYNWMVNVDAASDVDKVLWSPFIGDSRFSIENIGVYEGGYTFTMGIYRPTENSMMNENNCPFNAPSRKAIYDRIMLLGEGRDISSHEEFAAFDAQHKPQRWDYSTYSTRSMAPWQRRIPAPPRIVTHTGIIQF